jgi:hypothetical protein
LLQRSSVDWQLLQALAGCRKDRVGDRWDDRRGAKMTEFNQRTIEANGLRFHLTEAGSGPLVVLCHGFPES